MYRDDPWLWVNNNSKLYLLKQVSNQLLTYLYFEILYFDSIWAIFENHQKDEKIGGVLTLFG